MGNDLKFAVRNVFRNKKRSLLTASSIFAGAVIVAIAIGTLNGFIDNFISNYVDFQTGNLKITTKGYVSYERFLPVDETMTGAETLMEKIKNMPGVDSVEERIRFGILLGNEKNSVDAIGVGADLKSRRLDLARKLKEGTLESEGLYLGYSLAERLNLKAGDEILIATKTAYGGLNGIKVRVKGLLNFGVGVFDRKFFYIDLGSAKKLLKMDGISTEVLIFTDRRTSVPDLQKRITAILPDGTLVRNPADQIGSMYGLLIMAKYIYYIIDLLIILLASFVIISTMMQAVFERMREIGTLKAMGMTDSEIFRNFTLEGAIIGTIGGVPGAILGYLLVLLISVKGISFEQTKGMDLPFSFIIYPYIGPEVLIITVIMAVGMSALAAMIPAKSAGSLTAAEALRKL